jgi:hypothetical protein
VPRTIQNAQEADITIAVASDFATSGERLTADAARGAAAARRSVNRAGKESWVSDRGRPGEYGRVTELEQIDHLSANINNHVDSVVAKLNNVAATQNRPVVINGAGNGLARLKSQDEADAFARHVIERIVNHPNRGFEINYVVTGGQNGYDIAFAKAAKLYGIPTKINPPYTSNGSIMVQDPSGSRQPLFMSVKEYISKHRLDTAAPGIQYG